MRHSSRVCIMSSGIHELRWRLRTAINGANGDLALSGVRCGSADDGVVVLHGLARRCNGDGGWWLGPGEGAMDDLTNTTTGCSKGNDPTGKQSYDEECCEHEEEHISTTVRRTTSTSTASTWRWGTGRQIRTPTCARDDCSCG